MSKKNKITNYSNIKESLLINLKEDAKSLLKKKDETFYQLGETLNLIKTLTQHNEFSKFIEDEIDFSHNLANKYMRIASSYSKEDALDIGVRKAYALLSLKDEDRNNFLKDHDVSKMTCVQLDLILKEIKGKKVVDEKAKVKKFIKNLDNFKKDLSNKIALFSKYKYEMEDLLNEEDKDMLDKLEELNNFINNAKSVSIYESIQEEVLTTSYDIIYDSVESNFDYESRDNESFIFDFD